MHATPFRSAFLILSLSGAIAVILGAFGAHALRDLVSADSIQVWKTASFYHFIHTVAALAVLLMPGDARSKKMASRFFLWGILCFSGSLYLLSTLDVHHLPVRFLGPVTPVGGLLLTAGWLMTALSIYKGTTTA
ncbi:MAG: DUF423 domain-containing protein [Saprospiraceae bacterium]|nr:DUF423 domain-containing protein [Saprospiraceae bacterium]